MKYLAEREGLSIDETYDLVTRSVPLRRAADPDEIASSAPFLASPDASMVSGHVLVADGGGGAVVYTSTTIHDTAR